MQTKLLTLNRYQIAIAMQSNVLLQKAELL